MRLGVLVTPIALLIMLCLSFCLGAAIYLYFELLYLNNEVSLVDNIPNTLCTCAWPPAYCG